MCCCREMVRLPKYGRHIGRWVHVWMLLNVYGSSSCCSGCSRSIADPGCNQQLQQRCCSWHYGGHCMRAVAAFGYIRHALCSPSLSSAAASLARLHCFGAVAAVAAAVVSARTGAPTKRFSWFNMHEADDWCCWWCCQGVELSPPAKVPVAK